MIAYNRTWLNNLLVREQTDTAYQRNCISVAEKEAIYAAFPTGFYMPNFFVRIGLFILTVVIVQFSLGLVGLLILSGAGERHFGSLIIVYSILVYAGLEFMVAKKHYKSGVDDALMWMSAGGIISGMNLVSSVSLQTNALLVFIVSLFMFIRFTNALMAGIAAIAFITLVFSSFIRLGSNAKATTPFLLMAVSAAIYFFARNLISKQSCRFYKPGLWVVIVIALVCFALAGNYYVVREASIAMFNLNLNPGESIPLGWLFWLFTCIIPVLYIAGGIIKKETVMLRTGLLLVGMIVFTIRFYYHLLPPEIAMVSEGILFIGVAYFLTRFLRQPRAGFTYRQQDDAFFMDKLNVESLVIAQTFSGPQVSSDSGTQFGGGTGEGGGASAGF